MSPDYRLSVAPMMDWTDRHCRYFLRQCAPHARLYTEMIATNALRYGDAERLLAFDAAEQPVAAQLGGADPSDLAGCARLVETAGYAEVNLNVGCPSDRVQDGAFGACLMARPVLVADCVRAMRDAVSIPVTVKHRIGVDRIESYEFVRDFVGVVADAGCETFFVHARNAWLSGLSPRENREVPPLRHEFVHRLKRDFPGLVIVVNGGLVSWPDIEAQLRLVDGVMIGRAAYHDPWLIARADERLFGSAVSARTREDVVLAMVEYAARQAAQGVPLRSIARHMLGLYHGEPGARRWRRMLSDPSLLARNDPAILLEARAAIERALPQTS